VHNFVTIVRLSYKTFEPNGLRSSAGFVLVWDKRDADRKKIKASDLVPPVFSFAGEILDRPATKAGASVKGTGFSCYARSEIDVRDKMKASIFFKEVRSRHHATHSSS
jgi:hypothetical protein